MVAEQKKTGRDYDRDGPLLRSRGGRPLGGCRPAAGRPGFTLVELLVVITIIGILVALLLPAVQAAREAARMLQCNNHLKQMALGCLNHEQQQKALPAGGWGYFWNGDPNRGFTKKQPGGWLYNVLPYIELAQIHDLGLGDAAGSAAMHADISRIAAFAIPMFNCPSRRPVRLYPFDHTGYSYNMAPLPPNVGKSDYAGAGGELADAYGHPFTTTGGWQQFDSCAGPGPGAASPPYTDPTYGQGDALPDWSPPGSGSSWSSLIGGFTMLGVFRFHHATKIADITDGTSNTILGGEKNFDPSDYVTGQNWGDDQTWDLGWDWDVNRLACNPYQISQQSYGCSPILDMPSEGQATGIGSWGSAHLPGVNMALCDGSVRIISYSIDLETLRRLSDIADGLKIDGKNY